MPPHSRKAKKTSTNTPAKPTHVPMYPKEKRILQALLRQAHRKRTRGPLLKVPPRLPPKPKQEIKPPVKEKEKVSAAELKRAAERERAIERLEKLKAKKAELEKVKVRRIQRAAHVVIQTLQARLGEYMTIQKIQDQVRVAFAPPLPLKEANEMTRIAVRTLVQTGDIERKGRGVDGRYYRVKSR